MMKYDTCIMNTATSYRHFLMYFCFWLRYMHSHMELIPYVVNGMYAPFLNTFHFHCMKRSIYSYICPPYVLCGQLHYAVYYFNVLTSKFILPHIIYRYLPTGYML